MLVLIRGIHIGGMCWNTDNRITGGWRGQHRTCEIYFKGFESEEI